MQRILTAGDVLDLPPAFDPESWNVGRSGDLGHGLEVWTSYLPIPKGGEGTQTRYETLVVVPETLHAAYWRDYQDDSWITYTAAEASDTHRQIVQRLQRWLAEVAA